MLMSAALIVLAGPAARAERVNGSGRVVDETRPIGEFSRIEVSAGIQVRVDAGPRSALGIRAEDNILPYVRTEVHNGTLVIGFQPNTSITAHVAVQVSLAVPALDGLAASGGSRL